MDKRLTYEPKQHQRLAEDFLKEHNRCALFLDMGLGKTVITLTDVKRRIDDFQINRCLVIAPKRVAEDTWTREADKWEHLSDLRVVRVLGSQAQRIKALESDGDVYVINRENVQWLVDYYKERWNFDMLVIDELSSFKSPTSKRFRSLRRVAKSIPVVIGLTGTPASNGYMDLYSEMYLIDSGESLGKTLTSYRDRYFHAGARNGYIVYEWVMNYGAKEQIDTKLSEFCLSMSKDDWLTLPPIIYNDVSVRMDSKERKLYEAFQKDKVIPLLQGEVSSVDNIDSAIIGETAAVVSGKLLQMANGAVYDDSDGVFHLHDKKLEALEEIVESSQGQPILCFYNYKHDLSRILCNFKDATLLENSDTISKWNSGDISLLLCHPASAGHGLNLQDGGHIIVWFGLPWSLELYQQANARLYRQGQDKAVIVHHIICENTVDEKVLKVLQNKDSTQRSLLDSLKSYIKEKM